MKIVRYQANSDVKITREQIKANPKTLFLFGDNLQRMGLGGQAKTMRGEVNSLGIVTKRLMNHTEDALIFDNSTDIGFIKEIITLDFIRVHKYLRSGYFNTLVIPSLGTGLAKLHVNAPRLKSYIERHIDRIVQNEDWKPFNHEDNAIQMLKSGNGDMFFVARIGETLKTPFYGVEVISLWDRGQITHFRKRITKDEKFPLPPIY